ncbi:MAG: hypothetical protein JNJ88_02115 [Planctomycetes bacterium]|nr:hypothetical protein [Planctomycetota bacterium]
MHLLSLRTQAVQRAGKPRQCPGAQPVNSRFVADLLFKTAAYSSLVSARRAARLILERLAEHRWFVSCGIHEGGSGADRSRRITIAINRLGQWHLKLRGNGSLWDITGPDGRRIYPARPHETSPGQLHSQYKYNPLP